MAVNANTGVTLSHVKLAIFAAHASMEKVETEQFARGYTLITLNNILL